MRLAAAVILLLVTMVDAEEPPKNPCPGHGYFSCKAIELHDVAARATYNYAAIIPAPDHTRRIDIRRPRKLEGID